MLVTNECVKSISQIYWKDLRPFASYLPIIHTLQNLRVSMSKWCIVSLLTLCITSFLVGLLSYYMNIFKMRKRVRELMKMKFQEWIQIKKRVLILSWILILCVLNEPKYKWYSYSRSSKSCWYAKKAVDTQKETKGPKIKFSVFYIPCLVSQPFSELDFIGKVIAWE